MQDLVATAPREKVVRVALSSLRNLATCSDDEKPNLDSKTVGGSTFLGEMIGCGLIKSIDLMKERQWTDPDIVEGAYFGTICGMSCHGLDSLNLKSS